jgi:hypothetical protein
VWVYYSAQIFLLGAEFTWVYAHRYGSRARTTPSSAVAIPQSSTPAASEADRLSHPTHSARKPGRPTSNVFLAGGTLLALITLSACHEGAPKDILTSGQKYYSQHDEELIIRHFFDDQKGGVFLDVGCWDWKEGSTTLYLEEKLGWSGIGVDAQAEVRTGYEMHRPRTRFMNYIVTDHSGTLEKLYVAGQISSINEHHVEQFPGA